VAENRITHAVYVSVDRKVTRDIRLELLFLGDLDRDDYVLYQERFNPEMIKVTGPSKLVNTIGKAVVTFEGTLFGTFVWDFMYDLFTADGEPISLSYMEFLTMDYDLVELTIPVKMEKNVPLVLDFNEGGGITRANIEWELTPPSVKMIGEPDFLIDYNSHIAQTINLATLTSDRTVVFPIVFPDSVQNVDNIEEVQAEIRIIGASTRVVETENISITGIDGRLPEGYTYVIRTPQIPVTLRGAPADIINATPSHIRIEADFSSEPIVIGENTRRAEVTMIGFTTVGIVEIGYDVIIDVIPDSGQGP
jgi:hypothetical protein